MNAGRLLALYDRVADAPGAVDQLRRFVLDLAVRGELVEQDPTDEPASELLKRIAVKKVRMVEAGEIRRPRNLSNGEDLVPPFEIPATWCWRRLDVVGAIVGGGTPRAGDPRNFSEPGEGVAWLTPKDLGGHRSRYIERGSRDLSERGLRSSSATLMPTGTVLFSSRAPIGYVAIASNPISTNQGFKSIVPYVSGCSKYIALAMQAFAPDIEARAPGTTFKEASGKIVAGVPFPLPPLAEQRRIVAKVNELMALCDQLEETRAAREDTRDRLTKASLARLTAPDTEPKAFRAHARFAVNALPALTARADQVKYLRQTILNLAVRGKLVEQDPQEGSGRDVHARITSAPPSSPRSENVLKAVDGMYPLPSSWTWASLGQAIVAGPRNGLSPRPSAREDAPRAVTLTATTSGIFDGSHFKRVDADIGPDSDYWLQPNDLLFQRGNTPEYVGMAAIYDGPPGAFIFPDLMIRVRLSPEVNLRFAHLFCVSPAARSYFSENATGAQKTMPKINQAILRVLPIPLPPLAEQHRIVAKVDALMALCERMEGGLAATDGTRIRLLDSLLHESLGSHEARINGRAGGVARVEA